MRIIVPIASAVVAGTIGWGFGARMSSSSEHYEEDKLFFATVSCILFAALGTIAALVAVL